MLLYIFCRIRSLHWVTIQQLEANVNDQDIGVRIALDKSIAGCNSTPIRSKYNFNLCCCPLCKLVVISLLSSADKTLIMLLFTIHFKM